MMRPTLQCLPSRIRRMFVAGGICLGLGITGPAMAQAASLSPPSRLSQFYGVMECTGGKRTFIMTLRGGNRANLSGEISLIADGPVAPGGLYSVKASIDGKGLLAVAPVAWIGKPASKPMLGFKGWTRPDGLVVAGQSTTPGCTKLSLVLDSDDGYHPVLSVEYSVRGHKPTTGPIVLPLISNRSPLATTPAPPPRAAPASQATTRVRSAGAPRGGMPPHVVLKTGQLNLINTNDYPAKASREALTGDHYISLTVGPDGRPSACQPSAVTGEPSLATNSCEHAMRRARFGLKPGVTSAAISGTFVLYVRYFCEDYECKIGTRIE